MKTPEEQKGKADTMREKLTVLSEEELNAVVGGIDWLKEETGQLRQVTGCPITRLQRD